jgi:hypothetical protein
LKFKNAKQVIDRIKERVKGSITLYQEYADVTTKAITLETIKNFSKGIEQDAFGLRRLKPETIKAKTRKGYASPETPLLGKGGTDPRSYKNLLIYRKLRRGLYRIRPSVRYHHSGRVSLKTLFFVHEYGAVIDTGKAIIFIPPRPAFEKAIKSVKPKVKTRLLKQAIIKYINKGQTDFAKLILKELFK